MLREKRGDAELTAFVLSGDDVFRRAVKARLLGRFCQNGQTAFLAKVYFKNKL